MSRAYLMILASALIGCTSNMTFNTIDVVPKSDGHQVPRWETSAQGNAGDPGAPPSNGIHRVERTTAGGSYVRRQDPSNAQHKITAGMHEN